jgi:BirA family transcriptional regulator, biotin operon repressor / biotin---[acetyl-CoA-carboxylase] ligase
LLKIQPKTFFVGKNLVFLPSCHSTNDIASEIIQNKEFIDGTVIITDHQTAGKGQRGNRWESQPTENLLMSIVLKTSFLPIDQQFDLSVTVAISVLEALNTFQVPNLNIKWPNDLFLGEKKIGGILIENSILGTKINTSVVGIGINIHQQNFENPRASSLEKEINHLNFGRSKIAEKICERLESNLYLLQKNGRESIREKYHQNLFGKGQTRLFKTEDGILEGIILGITENGQLHLSTSGSKKYYNIKEIEYLFNE